ncbi:MAG TPA: hypothetical protein DIT09_07630 [Glutamicibacter sp.]|uniref:DUF6226 family protein n=1 Tax=Glutamicibacter arilaitensis TaxID=256701 RepID=UPI000EE53BB9|nr:hypothetical protein [Glutamicibacter sp.]
MSSGTEFPQYLHAAETENPNMLHGYQRPDIEVADHFDEHGALIPYGQRWDEQPPAESYSLTSHVQRFAPVPQVAQALLDWLREQFEVRCFEDPGLARQMRIQPGHVVRSVRVFPMDSRCAPLGMVFTTFPAVHLELGALYRATFPPCGCDGCDEVVPEILEELEIQVSAAASGGFGEFLDRGMDRLVHCFDVDGTGFGEQSRGLEDISPARLARARAILPSSRVWAPWPLR